MQYWKPGDTVRGGNVSIDQEYKEQLQKEHNGSKWGTTGDKYSGEWVRTLLQQRPYIRTVLDWGAGKGTLGASVQGVEWTDYDPGIPGIDVLPNTQFDLVVSTDCLEHVEPTHIENTLSEIGQRTGKVVALDIPCYETGKVFGEGPYKGRDLHLIVKPPNWWKAMCDKYLGAWGLQLFEYQNIQRRHKGSLRSRVRLIYERV